MALLMLVLGVLAFTRMNADIFPAIDLPVVEVVWNYPGLSAVGMERRVVIISERSYSSEVNAIEHIESESLNGIGLIKVYFHEGTSPAAGIAEINNTNESELKIFPPGISTADVIEYNAANVPVAQLNLFSDTLSVQQLYDYGLNFARVRLFTIPGLWTPAPFGGMQRAVMVNLNPQQLYAHGLSATDIMQALGAVNTITPAGTVKIGNREYQVELNGSPVNVAEFDHLPVKEVNGAPVHLGDVAPVTYTHSVQTNVVRVNGKPASYLMILKAASASTVGIVDQVKSKLPEMSATAPAGLKMALTFDQSKFVRGALWDVVQEAAVAALLVALMVLVFLGSVRSMLIVVISIPLAALTAIVGLKLSGQTINTMTLGGLALAVGMLVDDATVEIENIHRNHAMGKPLLRAIVDGAAQIAAPAFVGTLAICIVFFPVVLLTGVARFLFTPLAMAVVYAMLTSYLLSRTLVPMMARYLLPERHVDPALSGWHGRFTGGFERLTGSYHRALESFIAQRGFGMACVGLIVVMSLGLIRVVGEDFFPAVDAGMMRLHVRAPLGTRIETTEQIVERIEKAIRTEVAPSELEAISDNLGMPVSWNLTMYQTDSIGPQDGDIAIELKPKHRPTAYYQGRIRALMARQFPGVTAYFQAADIVAQVLNFGLPAAIDAQVAGSDLNGDYAIAARLKSAMQKIPGLADIRIAQPLNYPTLDVRVDRDKAQQLGLTENDVASSLATSLSASFELQPNSWLNVANGVNYSVLAQVPQHTLNSVNALLNTPLTANDPGQTPAVQFLGNVATVDQDVEPAVVSHYNLQRVIDVDSGVVGRDLGSSTAAVERAIGKLGRLPRGTSIQIRGQSQAMRESFGSLEEGLLLAAVLVYLLMVANFQSWMEPLVIFLAVPGTLAGCLWMLVLTGTTINVESLMGAIMAIGVGVANANLVVIFANDLREQGYTPLAAALEASRIRLRPVLMTALAMILGMLPMSLALGAGAEQNAPLGRAVIGGLLAATFMTLFVVPAAYSLFGREIVGKHQRDAEIAALFDHQI